MMVHWKNVISNCRKSATDNKIQKFHIFLDCHRLKDYLYMHANSLNNLTVNLTVNVWTNFQTETRDTHFFTIT